MYLPSFSSLNFLNVNVFAITTKRLNLEIQLLSYTSTVKNNRTKAVEFPPNHEISWQGKTMGILVLFPSNFHWVRTKRGRAKVTESFSEHHRQYADETCLHIFAGKEEWTSGVHTIEQCTHALYNWLPHIGLALNHSNFDATKFSHARCTETVRNINVVGASIAHSGTVTVDQEPPCHPRLGPDIRRPRSSC